MLDTPARETTVAKKKANGKQVKKWVKMVSVTFKHEHRKTLAEKADAVSSVVDSSADCPDPASDVFVVEIEIVKKEAPWDLRDMKSKDDRSPFGVQWI